MESAPSSPPSPYSSILSVSAAVATQDSPLPALNPQDSPSCDPGPQLSPNNLTSTAATNSYSASPIPPPPHPSLPPAPCHWPHHNRGVILYPELAHFLIHPQVDPYADAPRIPGQPDPSCPRPPLVNFIPDFAEQWTPPKHTGQLHYHSQCVQQAGQPGVSFTKCELKNSIP